MTSLTTAASELRPGASLAERARGKRAWIGLGLWALASMGEAPAASTAAPEPNYADLSLEQLMDLRVARVYGASRQVQKITRAPSSVSILGADDFRRFGWRTLSDMLSSVRGFHVSDDRNYTYAGTRGFLRSGDYNTRMLLLIDGHRLNDNVFDGSYVGREQMIAADSIERVEIIRGPASSVYGSSAFFGVINVVTKRPAGTAARLATEVGDNSTFESRLAFEHVFRNGAEWLVSATHFTTEGEDRLYFPEFDPRRSALPMASNGGVAVDSDAERSAHAFTKFAYGDLTISAFVARRLKEVPTASYGTVFNHGTERTVDRRGYLDVKLERASGVYRVAARAFYDVYRYEIDRLLTLVSTPAGSLFFENSDAIRASGVEVEFEGKHESGWLVRASQSWQRAEDGATREWLTHSPRALTKINVAWESADRRFSAGMELQRQSASRTLSGGTSAGFAVVNLHLWRGRIRGAYDVSLTATNLLDRRYGVPAGEEFEQDILQQARRGVRLMLKREF